jgi:hypothetical protein
MSEEILCKDISLNFLVYAMSNRFTTTTIRKLFIACIPEHILASALKTPCPPCLGEALRLGSS